MICSGYADRIHDLMTISRELIAQDTSSMQRNGSRNYVSEANYIEFDNVKVHAKLLETLPCFAIICVLFMFLIILFFSLPGGYTNW